MMKKRQILWSLGPLAIVTLLTFLIPPPAHSEAEPFFKGKTIRLIQARRPGGAGDMRARRAMMSSSASRCEGRASAIARTVRSGI